ncbi:uncharacterized protein LOC143835950 [Paroedura picta]|uniref:uncharacterized protein LOC143835950 n=1 Tax=Paroedura picta TaxID=143630 RepID=UPI004056405A
MTERHRQNKLQGILFQARSSSAPEWPTAELLMHFSQLKMSLTPLESALLTISDTVNQWKKDGMVSKEPLQELTMGNTVNQYKEEGTSTPMISKERLQDLISKQLPNLKQDGKMPEEGEARSASENISKPEKINEASPMPLEYNISPMANETVTDLQENENNSRIPNSRDFPPVVRNFDLYLSLAVELNTELMKMEEDSNKMGA